MTEKSGRLPSLDGLRAVAILMVILGHVAMLYPVTLSDTWNRRQAASVLQLGHLGVLVFFVISGFLITGLLLAEREHSGTVSLRAFYTRRVLRIFPAFYFYLAVIAALKFIGVVHLPTEGLARAATYTSNYCDACSANASWQIAHTWSLSVEEQFYLLWPAALVFLRPARAKIAGFAALIAAPAMRAITVLFVKGRSAQTTFYTFETVADALLVGCLLALYRREIENSMWFERIRRGPWFWVLVAVAFALYYAGGHPIVYGYSPAVYGTLFTSALNIAIGIIVLASVHRRGWEFHLLNSRTMVFIGVLSYSLYLWQQVFLVPGLRPDALELLMLIAAIVTAAAISYYLIERPILRLKVRFTRDRQGMAGVTEITSDEASWRREHQAVSVRSQ